MVAPMDPPPLVLSSWFLDKLATKITPNNQKVFSNRQCLVSGIKVNYVIWYFILF